MAVRKPKQTGDAKLRAGFFSRLSRLIGQPEENIREVFSGIRSRDIPLVDGWLVEALQPRVTQELSPYPLIQVPDDPAYALMKRYAQDCPENGSWLRIEPLKYSTHYPQGHITLRQVSSPIGPSVNEMRESGVKYILFGLYADVNPTRDLKLAVLISLDAARDLPVIHHRVNPNGRVPYILHDIRDISRSVVVYKA